MEAAVTKALHSEALNKLVYIKFMINKCISEFWRHFHRSISSEVIRCYLSESLALSDAMLKEQSFPPYPVSHLHDAVHVASKIVHVSRIFPEGSEYPQEPCCEHTDPGQLKEVRKEN